MLLFVFASTICILFLSALFIFLIFPIWALVDCANSTSSKGTKTLWVIVMVLFWPLGGFVYGLFGTAQKWLRGAAVLVVIFCLLFVGLLASTINRLVDALYVELNYSLNPGSSVDFSELKQHQQLELERALGILKDEAQLPWLAADRKVIARSLLEVYRAMIEDHHFSFSENAVFMKMFLLRQVMNMDFLHKSLRNLKFGTDIEI